MEKMINFVVEFRYHNEGILGKALDSVRGSKKLKIRDKLSGPDIYRYLKTYFYVSE